MSAQVELGDHYSGLGGHGDCIAPVSIIVLVMFVEPDRSQSSPCGEKREPQKLVMMATARPPQSFIVDIVDVFWHRQAVVGSGEEVYSNIVNAQV